MCTGISYIFRKVHGHFSDFKIRSPWSHVVHNKKHSNNFVSRSVAGPVIQANVPKGTHGHFSDYVKQVSFQNALA